MSAPKLEWKRTGRDTGLGLSLVFDDGGPCWAAVDKLGDERFMWSVTRKATAERESARLGSGDVPTEDEAAALAEMVVWSFVSGGAT